MILSSNSLAVAYNRSGIFSKTNCSYLAGEECFGMHWHDRFELIAIHSGSLLVDFGQRSALVPSGSVVIIPPKQSHSAFAGDEGVCYDSVSFDIRYFYNQTAACSNLFPLIFDGKMQFEIYSASKDVFSLVTSVSRENISNTEELWVVGDIYKLLSLLATGYVIRITDSTEDDSNFASIIEYINANYQLDISTSELCKTFGYTKPYFCRRFKEYTGVSPMLYLKSRRLEAACELLQKDNASIGDISAACGFNDPNYFTRCFKGHFGISPVEYRKQSKG